MLALLFVCVVLLVVAGMTLAANDPSLYAPSETSEYYLAGQLAKLDKVDHAAARFYVEAVLDTLSSASRLIQADLLQLDPKAARDSNTVIDYCLSYVVSHKELYEKPAHIVVWHAATIMGKPKA